MYVGETVRIKSTITDFNGDALTPDSVTTAEVTIYIGATPLVGTLTYSTTREYWFYDWDTEGMAGGSYKAKLRFVGAAYDTWEYLTIRLKAIPEGVT